MSVVDMKSHVMSSLKRMTFLTGKVSIYPHNQNIGLKGKSKRKVKRKNKTKKTVNLVL